MTKAEIQLVRSLADKRSRTEHGLFVAEGHKFIGELCTSALRVRKIFALEGLFEGGEVETVSSREMERLSLLKTPSDSLALVEIPHHPFRPDTAQRELVLALDQVQNPGNLGTIIRLADWFGIPEIVCSPTTADCYNPKVVQATMGAILRVKVHYTALEPYLAQARERNIPVYGTFLEGENIYSTPLTPGGIVLIGQRRPRDRSGRRTTRIAQTVHPALSRRPQRFGIAQRSDRHARRLRRIPPAGERKEIRQVRKTRENRTGESAFSRQIPVRCIF